MGVVNNLIFKLEVLRKLAQAEWVVKSRPKGSIQVSIGIEVFDPSFFQPLASHILDQFSKLHSILGRNFVMFSCIRYFGMIFMLFKLIIS